MRADSILTSSRRTAPVVLASFGANLLSLAVPMAMIQIYDRVIPNQGVETLIVLGCVVMGSILADVLLRGARRFILESAGERFELAAYPAAVKSLVMSAPSPLDRTRQGDLYQNLMGIERLRSAHTGETSTALLDLPFAFLFLAIVAVISPEAGLTIFFVLSAAFMVLRIARSRVLILREERQENEARRHSFLSETLRDLESVKGMRIENFMQRRYERLLGASAKISATTARSVQLAQGFTAAIGTLSPLLMGSIGALMVIEGKMTIGGLAAIIMLTSRIIQPILRVEAYLAGMDNIRKDREDLEDLLAISPIRSGATPIETIEHLSLSFVASDAAPNAPVAFAGVHLELQKGDCLLLTGPDCESKTAFLHLLAGDVPLTSGDIRVNGAPLFSHMIEDRQERIRYIGNDNVLINGSLIDNMTMFRPRKFRDRAIALAQEIGIEPAIAQTPDGFDLQVGAGAKARLSKSLADAALIVGGLVTDPDVVLFDEANAALDREIDGKLLNHLEKHRENRITILVSPRPSYQKLANRTLDITPFLDRGGPGGHP